MRIILDTHAFLWFIQGNDKLSAVAKSSIENLDNQKLVSVASLWEIAIKISIGKIEIGMTLEKLLQREIYGNSFGLLNIDAMSLDELAKLPFHHKDPFDRLIIAQSITKNISIVSKDNAFKHYPINLIW